MKRSARATKASYNYIRAVDETAQADRRKRMTKEEFRAAVMRERGMTVDDLRELDANIEVVPWMPSYLVMMIAGNIAVIDARNREIRICEKHEARTRAAVSALEKGGTRYEQT